MDLFFVKLVVVLVLTLVNGDEHNHIVSEMRTSTFPLSLTRTLFFLC